MENKKQISVQSWVWRSMVKTGIIPLILVEVVLVTVFLISNHYINSDNMKYIQSQVNNELTISTSMESNTVRERILSIARLAEIYRSETERVLSEEPTNKNPFDPNLALSESGVLYSKFDDGGSASYYSSIVKNKDLVKVTKLSKLDSLMKQLKQSDPFIAAVYFNSWDSYNRIYPWFQTLEQYPPDMNIPDYNFYYLATDKYNPERKAVWTDVYIDPAGHGWMTSVVAPVYVKGQLEGVVGLDITVDTIVKNIQNLSIPWDGYAVLVSETGNIMALPPQGEYDLNIKELKQHEYQQAITKEVFKPHEFNLFKRNDTSRLKTEFDNSTQGLTKLVLNDKVKFVSWATIPETSWKVLFVVDEQKMYQESIKLKEKYQKVGYVMIMGLIGFYIMFLAFTWYVSKRMSRSIAEPLFTIRDMFYQVSTGKFDISYDDFHLKELNDTANATIRMGKRLDKLTSQLKSAKVEADEANKSKSRFISNISHEIRTPMNSILALSDMLLKEKLEHEQEKSLKRIKKSGEHLLLVINDVLDISKIESGRLHIEAIPFDIYSLVKDVYELFEPRLVNKYIGFEVNVEEGIRTLIGDPLRIKQILINFVSNAIKFTEHGEISIHVTASKNKGSTALLNIAVTDTGIGLSEDDMQKIFGSFQQADSSTTRKYGGTGLGLTISRSIADLMGGVIGVKSKLKEGSTFWFEVELNYDDQSDLHTALSMSNHLVESVIDSPRVDLADCMDIDIFKSKVSYLQELLEQNNLEAEDYFFEHRPCFEKAVPHYCGPLAEYVSQCDFSNALVIVKRIHEHLIEPKPS